MSFVLRIKDQTAHLPAAECFHPCSFFAGSSGGEAVDGGVEEDGDADVIRR